MKLIDPSSFIRASDLRDQTHSGLSYIAVKVYPKISYTKMVFRLEDKPSYRKSHNPKWQQILLVYQNSTDSLPLILLSYIRFFEKVLADKKLE